MSELSTEPILGWRLWHVRLHGDEHRLESFTWHHVSWPPKRRFEASCVLHRDAAPVDDHECGIWGRILAREKGFRAQYAYPYVLHLIGGDDHIARELRDRYAVDVSRV